MARRESDREDLLRDATALVERIELAPGVNRLCATGSASAGDAEPTANIVVGFRPNGAASFFFGPDPVYQFNAAGELRRAFCGGLLYKALRGQLVSLRRERQATEVRLVSSGLSEVEQTEFIGRMIDRLRDLRDELDGGRYAIVGQAPAGVDVLDRVRRWLAEHEAFAIAKSPRV